MPKSVYTKTYHQFLTLLMEARNDAGLTQVELAEKIGWQQSDVSKVERGERRLDVAEFLMFANALKIDAADLIRKLQGRR